MILLLLLFLFPCVANAANYYIRTDGGTSTQCTGTTDAAYDGSGTGEACAFNNLMWATGNNNGTAAVMSGGDTVYIKSGSYRSGYGAAQATGDCDSTSYTYACYPRPIPDGTSNNHTKILGEGWDSGCSNPPELYGVERTETIININNSDYVDIQCLDITDHEACGNYGTTRTGVFDDCTRATYPHGDYAENGIRGRAATNIYMKDIKIHGISERGILSGAASNWTLDNVDIYGNGETGIDFDYPGTSDDSNSGTLNFSNGTIRYNGCVEMYPNLGVFDNCIGQGDGGQGDGLGATDTAGVWTFTNYNISFNTQDGLDLLYLRQAGGQLYVSRLWAEGNAGNQLKVAQSFTIQNSMLIGNCDYYDYEPGLSMRAPSASFSNCRSGGSTITSDAYADYQGIISNTTISGRGTTLIEVNNEGADQTCTGNELIKIDNAIFVGNYKWYAANPDNVTWYYLGGTDGNGSGSCGTSSNPVEYDIDNSIVYNVKATSDACPTGTNISCTDPYLENSPLNGHLVSPYLTSNSTNAINMADETVSMFDGSNDVNNFSRGASWDIGGFEYGSVLTGDVLNSAQTGGAVSLNGSVVIY